MSSRSNSSTDALTSILGMKVLTLPTHNIVKTCGYYTRVFPLERLDQYDEYDAKNNLTSTLLIHEQAKVIVEVVSVPKTANIPAGRDSITLQIPSRDALDKWGDRLDYCGVRRSKVLGGRKGWTMTCSDPEGKIVRLCCTAA